MLKNLALTLCSIFIFTFPVVTTSFAGNYPESDQESKKIFKFYSPCCSRCHCCCPCCPVYQASFTKLSDLLTKYEKAPDNKKDSIKKDLEKMATEFLDKKIAMKKEKIAKLQALVNKYESNKQKVIADNVEYLTSDEGIKEINKIKMKIDKHKEHNEKKK